MADYDLKQNFPIAGVADLYSTKPTRQAQIDEQNRQDLLKGIGDFSSGVQNIMQQRRNQAQALVQTQALSQLPHVQDFVNGPQDPNNPLNPAIRLERTKGILQDTLGETPLSPEAFLKALQPPPTITNTILQYDANGNPIGSPVNLNQPKGSKVTVVKPNPASNQNAPQQTQFVDKDGTPLVFNKQTGSYSRAGVGEGVTPVTRKGDENAITDATLLANQIPNIKTMFDAYRNSESPRLQSTQLGRLMNPAGKQAENALKLAAFTFGGKNLTGQEKEVVFGALFPSVTDNAESRAAKEQLLSDYMTGKIDLLQAANLLGPAGEPLRNMISSLNSRSTSNASAPKAQAEQPAKNDLQHLSTKELMDLKKKLTAHKEKT